MTEPTTSRSRQAIAWSIHLLTGLGAVIGMMAVIAIAEQQYHKALLWLVLAMVVDGVDGPLARLFKVKNALPHFNGDTVDDVIDYFTYVVIPAVFLYQTGLVPHGWGLIAAGMILLVSLYFWGNDTHKSEDWFFQGFPAVWNIVVFYLYVLQMPPWVNLVLVIFLALLSFAPIYFVHPARVVFMRKATMTVTLLWGVVNFAILMTYERTEPGWLMVISLAFLIYLCAIGIWRTIKGPLT
jgi:phosphatidylcholine synthase